MVEPPGSQNGSTPAMVDGGGRVPLAADIHHDEKHGQISHHPGSNKQESIEQLHRRPSFMQNLADSRDSQFQMQHLSELERYFVSGPPGETPERNKEWQEELMGSTFSIAWTPKYGQTFEMAHSYAHAWECTAPIDSTIIYCGRLGDPHYLHVSLLPQP